MATYVFSAPNSTEADTVSADYAWPASGPTSEFKSLFARGGATFEFLPGTYPCQGTLTFGSNSIVKGSGTIPIPANKKTTVTADPTKMAVFTSTRVEPETVQCGTGYMCILQAGTYNTPGVTGVTFQDLYLTGYASLRLFGAKNSFVTRCVVNNYHGTYPSGSWANMGYSSTGAIWLCRTADTVVLRQCVAQYSHHHGILIHGPYCNEWFKNITMVDCRALSCGCGLLAGENAEQIATAKSRLPQRSGRGWYDWSCGIDICEKGSIENVLLEDCYANDCWKVGIYCEPWKQTEPTQHWNLRLVRCVSENSGQRAAIRLTGDTSDLTIPKETEGSNYYIHQATLTDCISRNGWKAGYYFDPEGKLVPAAQANRTRVLCTGCVDCGSRYGFVSEMNASGYVTLENCVSLNNAARALRLYGNGGPYIVKNIRIKTPNATKSPVLLGSMCRLQFAWSRDPGNANAVKTKYQPYTITMTNLVISGTVEGLQAGTNPIEIRQGSVINGATRGSTSITNVSLTTATTAADTSVCTGSPTTPTGPEVPDVPVEAAFTATPVAGAAPLVVKFADQSAGDPIAWSWSFGDGMSSGEQNPPHTYATPGTYSPTLVATNEAGDHSTLTKPAYITVGQGPTVPTPSPRYAISLVRTEEERDADGALILTAVLRVGEGST